MVTVQFHVPEVLEVHRHQPQPQHEALRGLLCAPTGLYRAVLPDLDEQQATGLVLGHTGDGRRPFRAHSVIPSDPAANPFRLVVDPVMRMRLRKALMELTLP